MPSAAPLAMASMAAADWAELDAELDCWGDAGRIAKLWWRDDDAVAATPQLATLLRVAGGRPVALAVIPALATADLAAALAGAPAAGVLQHGWRHANRARARRASTRAACPLLLRQPRLRRDATVSPRCSGHARSGCSCRRGTASRQSCSPSSPLLGIAAVSTIASPTKPKFDRQPTGLGALDVHVDLTDWKGGRRFIGTAKALGGLVFWLRRGRLGNAVAAGPIGILTHHLIMDRETAAFVAALQERIAGHRAARWVDIAELLR